MRLIDADKIGIGKANPDVFENKAYADGWNSAIEIINAAPTVDAVAVIRCKDCIHYIAGYCCRDVKSRTNMAKYEPDDFCSYAVRRE